MAQYRIDYRCGHSETKQLYGKELEQLLDGCTDARTWIEHRDNIEQVIDAMWTTRLSDLSEWIEQLEGGAK